MRQLLEFCLCRLLESLDKEEDAELLMTAAQACKRCVFYACVRWETHAEGVLLLCCNLDGSKTNKNHWAGSVCCFFGRLLF